MTSELRAKIESVCQRHRHDPEWPWSNSRIGKYIKYKGAHVRAAEVAEVTSGMDFTTVEHGPAAKKASKPGMTKREFLEEFDPYTRTRRDINRGLTKHLESDRYIKDAEFRKLCGVSDHRMWRDVVVDPAEGFTGYQFIYGEQRWWTTEKSAAEMIAATMKAKAVE